VQSDSDELDASLVERIRGGDREAFATCFRVMHGALVAFAARYTGDRARAEEIVQDLFFALWQERGSLAVRSSLRSYLFAAARNLALNLRRRDAVEQDWSDAAADDDLRPIHPMAPRFDLQLEEAQEAAQLHERVSAAFAALPERCRLAMHLRWREGLSYSEIADTLGIGTKGVENQLARGLKALRARLAHDIRG
jgi:RNA polymerase sigma-70 factor, ECF subfamily